MVFEALLDPIFSPLLGMNPLIAVILISLIISIIITVVYKYVTDQKRMKELKDTIKTNQKRMKELKDDPKKVMEVQKKTMEINMELMKHSFKPTIITLLPIIIIFGWLNMNMGFMPIQPGEDFMTTLQFAEGVQGDVTTVVPDGVEILSSNIQSIQDGTVEFKYTGETGDYLLEYKYGGRSFQKEVRINEERYAPPLKAIDDGDLKQIITNNQKLIVLNLFGWKLGWLGAYIIFSIIFSMGIRKAMKVY